MNRNLVILCLLTVICCMTFGCKSKTVVKKLPNNYNGQKNETDKLDGVMYRLPRTVIQISVPVKKVAKTPGQFAKFAPCFFPEYELQNLIKLESTKFSIEQPTFSSKGEPDPDQTYVVQTKGRFFESKTLLVEYAPEGRYILQKATATSTDTTLDFTIKAATTVIGLAAKGFAIAATESEKKNREDCYAKVKEFYTVESKPQANDSYKAQIEKRKNQANNFGETEQSETLNKILKKIDDDLKVIPTPSTVTDNLKPLVERLASEYETAKEAYKKLDELRSARAALITTGVPSNSAETFKQQLEETNKQIKAYENAFLGYKENDQWTGSFEHRPSGDLNHLISPPLFSFSDSKGVCRDGILKQKNIEIKNGFEYENCNRDRLTFNDKQLNAVWLSYDRDNQDAIFRSRIETAALKSAGTDKSRGWHYRIPANATIILKVALLSEPEIAQLNTLSQNIKPDHEAQVLIFENSISGNLKKAWQDERAIAQMGVVASVPASTGGKSSSTTIELDPGTGAMRNFKVSSDPMLDKSIIEDAEKAATAVIDANDTVKKKERELKLLQLQNNINAEIKTASQSQNGNNNANSNSNNSNN